MQETGEIWPAFKTQATVCLLKTETTPDGTLINYDHLLNTDPPLVQHKIYSCVKTGDVVFDVGAGNGGYTLPFGASGARVYAFEPDRVRYNQLVHNISLNDFNIKSYNWALSDSEGERQITTDGGFRGGVPCGLVKCMTLDSLARKPLDFIKIDVEGAEMDVLRGARHTLESLKPAVFVEVHPSVLAEADHIVYDFMKSLEYKMVWNLSTLERNIAGYLLFRPKD